MGNKAGRMKVSKKKDENGATKDKEAKQGEETPKPEGEQPPVDGEKAPEAAADTGEKPAEGEDDKKVAEVGNDMYMAKYTRRIYT